MVPFQNFGEINGPYVDRFTVLNDLMNDVCDPFLNDKTISGSQADHRVRVTLHRFDEFRIDHDFLAVQPVQPDHRRAPCCAALSWLTQSRKAGSLGFNSSIRS